MAIETYNPNNIYLYIKTENPPDDNDFSIRVANHHDHSDRVWLGTHIYWAARNNRHVTLRTATKAEYYEYYHQPAFKKGA